MKSQLDKLGIEHTFIEAVNGKQKAPEDFSEYNHDRRMRLMDRALTGTEVACTLSHLKAMQHAIDNNLQRVCILEDDGLLKTNFKEQLRYTFELSSEYEFVSLYNNKVKDTPSRTLKRSRYKQWSSSLGYVITVDAIRKVLQHNKSVLFIAGQAIMGRPEIGMKIWYLLPKCIQLNEQLESDIGDARNRRNYTLLNRIRRTRYQLTSWLSRTLYVLSNLKGYL